jgi:DNA-binding transcriptional LysR family regulator
MVGAIMGAAPDIVARAVVELKARRPLLVVQMLGETNDEILNLLAQHKIDLAVGRFNSPLQHNEFNYEALANEVLYLVGRAGHSLSGMDKLELRELADCAWIVHPLTSPTRQLLEQEFARAQMATPLNIVETSSIFATLQLLQKSDAVAVLPESVLRDHLTAGLLSRLPLVIETPLPGFGILTRRGQIVGGTVVEFIRALRKSANLRDHTGEE